MVSYTGIFTGESMKQYHLLLLALFFSQISYSQTPEEKGLEIAQKIDKANKGFIGEESTSNLILIDAHGAKVVRKMRGMTMETTDGNKSISEFLSPADVKGTKMLTWSFNKKKNLQWLYLPSFRRVKKISSSGKSASFMGSEFTYEDIAGQQLEKFTYKWIKNISEEGMSLWVWEFKAKGKSGYSKQVVTSYQKYLGAKSIKYYDKKGVLLKVANFGQYKSHKIGKKILFRAEKIHIKNIQTRKESILKWSKRKLGVKFNVREFKKTSLR